MFPGRRPTFWALSIAISAWRIAIARSYDLPVFIRPSTSMVHFQPVGLAVWTTVYWMSLCSIGNSKMAAKTRQGLAGVRTASPLIRRSRCRPFMAPVRSAATSGDRNGSGDIAVDAAEFTPTRFDKRKAHLLAALQTRRRWRVFWHVTRPEKTAGALPISQSPGAEDGR